MIDMGSSQSLPSDVTKLPPSDKTTNTNNTNSSSSESSTTKKSKPKPPQNETGYDRATRICRKKKRLYDACYTAQLSSKEEDCDELFESYKTCFLRVMTKDMEKRGVKVSENSMIGEYKDEIEEEDENNSDR